MPGRSSRRACPLWWAPLVLDRGADRCGWAQPRGAWVADGRAGHQVVFLGKASPMTAYGVLAWSRRTPGRSGWGERASRPRLPRIS